MRHVPPKEIKLQWSQWYRKSGWTALLYTGTNSNRQKFWIDDVLQAVF